MSTVKPLARTLVSYNPHLLGHSLARILWGQGLHKSRQVGSDDEANIVLYDEVYKAVEGFKHDPRVLRVVVATEMPLHLPKGIFWIKPDIQAFTNLTRTLNPGSDS